MIYRVIYLIILSFMLLSCGDDPAAGEPGGICLTEQTCNEGYVCNESKDICEEFIITIPDFELKKCIEEHLDEKLQSTEITLKNALQLFILNCTKRNIKNISGLEHFTNLYELFLSQNFIEDISFLKPLIKLEKLNLMNNQHIKDISSLEKMIKMRTLYLTQNQIEDLYPIRNMIYLTDLRVAYLPVEDISFFNQFKNLKILMLSDSKISDISSLLNLENLTEVLLQRNCIPEIQCYQLSKKIKEGGTFLCASQYTTNYCCAPQYEDILCNQD